MALSLSPQQLKQTIHTPSLSNTQLVLQPYSTPRQFTEAMHNRTDPETLPMSQTESPVHSSNFGHITHDEDMHKSTSPSQVIPDLPSWTPLRTLGDNESLSLAALDPKVDDKSSNKKATDSAMERLGELPPNARATAKNTTTAIAGRILQSLSGGKPSKAKKARFDGVFIAAKPPFRYQKYGSQKPSGPAPASSARVFSLVDALARTFDANKHTEGLSPRRSRTASHPPDSASSAPPTDVETTEAEDDQLRLNTRLVRTPLKRRARFTNASETNSEDATSLVKDILPPERPVKRLKPIQYETNPELIDAALGTVRAPISWDAEMDIITRGDDNVVIPAQSARVPSANVQMTVDEGDKGCVPSSSSVGNEWHMPTWGNPKRTVLTPYLSRGAKFRQQLDVMFGENATVRTDRVARPRPADYDQIFVPFDELDRKPSPHVSESTASVNSASAVEEGASVIPSTRITSQSPDIPPADPSMDHLPRNRLNEVDSLTQPTFDASDEEQIRGWVTALQRLVKGKVHVQEEDLETLSIILAEIESMKDSLDESVPMNSELRESVKQLSELYEIPFGDRNKLRQRAENIFHTWRSQELIDDLVR